MDISLATRVNAAIIDINMQLETQINRLQSYEEDLKRLQETVDAVLGGSATSYDAKMKSQIDSTKQQITDTLASLAIAKDMLFQISVLI